MPSKMHCPAILVSVKELLFSTYKNPLYIYVYVCVLLPSMKHFAVYIQEHLRPLLEVQMPLRFNTTAGKSSAPLRDSRGQFRGAQRDPSARGGRAAGRAHTEPGFGGQELRKPRCY